MTHTCDKCSRVFNKEITYARHIKKNNCNLTENTIETVQENIPTEEKPRSLYETRLDLLDKNELIEMIIIQQKQILTLIDFTQECKVKCSVLGKLAVLLSTPEDMPVPPEDKNNNHQL